MFVAVCCIFLQMIEFEVNSRALVFVFERGFKFTSLLI